MTHQSSTVVSRNRFFLRWKGPLVDLFFAPESSQARGSLHSLLQTYTPAATCFLTCLDPSPPLSAPARRHFPPPLLLLQLLEAGAKTWRAWGRESLPAAALPRSHLAPGWEGKEFSAREQTSHSTHGRGQRPAALPAPPSRPPQRPPAPALAARARPAEAAPSRPWRPPRGRLALPAPPLRAPAALSPAPLHRQRSVGSARSAASERHLPRKPFAKRTCQKTYHRVDRGSVRNTLVALISDNHSRPPGRVGTGWSMRKYPR